ncbi:hypothetical protein [Winogradskyella sediminis]|jgi:hypothetical protein|uniref:hypothetical protein n=1 Tax=Winogradskyella sediminis TaxID=1382466 RepID=UPI000E2537F9|nr:hypothetical protein [Winogradskyella sediminis]REG87512.1 hypothetical protein C8N41_102350 [Winogradskyella sediminis]
MSRICIYPKDVQVVTGKSERYGRTIIKKIKERLNKEAHQLVTIDEFCDFMGFEISKVQGLIK